MASFLMCVVLLATTIPTATAIHANDTAAAVNQKDATAKRSMFTKCYIEASGLLSDQWNIVYLKPFNNEFAIVCVWKIFLGDDGKTTIFNKENGRVLYECQGQRELLLIGFIGDYYHTTEKYYGITIKGNVFLARTSFYIP